MKALNNNYLEVFNGSNCSSCWIWGAKLLYFLCNFKILNCQFATCKYTISKILTRTLSICKLKLYYYERIIHRRRNRAQSVVRIMRQWYLMERYMSNRHVSSCKTSIYKFKSIYGKWLQMKMAKIRNSE